jgi:hypothetical protein
MTQPLFLDQALDFGTKTAGTLTAMSDDGERWGEEVLSEAYRQISFLSDFDVNVAIDKEDQERGYAWGSIEVRPRSDMSPEEEGGRPLATVHIPVIIKDQMLSPLDLFLDIDEKRYQPLTESRMRKALFRPETFDAIRTAPPQPSLYNELQPPLGSSVGGSIKTGALVDKGVGAVMGGVVKGSGKLAMGVNMGSNVLRQGAKLAHVLMTPLLPQLQGRVRSDHIARIKTAVMDDALHAQILNADEGVRAAFSSALSLEPPDLVKTAAALFPKPNVVQVSKAGRGKYRVKYANTGMYAPAQEQVGPEQAQAVLGSPDLVQRMEEDGSVTMSPDAAIKETLDTGDIKNVDQFGTWRVQDKMGNQLVGWAFPQVMSMDLQPLPMVLFTNGSQYAIAETIAGRLVGKSTDLPKSPQPAGYGFLYHVDDGGARAFVPMTIRATFTSPAGTLSYQAVNDMGEIVTFNMVEGLKTIAKVGEGTYAVPLSFRWLPLKGQTELIETADMFTKTANADFVHKVFLRGEKGAHSYSFDGPPLTKLASEEKTFLNRADAEFLGVSLGISPGHIKVALDKAALGKRLEFNACRMLTTVKEKMAAAREAVKEDLLDLEYPIRNFNLIKEASVLTDALTADKILGLGFLNAENVATFVDMLPGLELASSRIAELLVSSRLGLEEVPEIALERMLAAMNDVILGLNKLKQREITFAADQERV